MGTECTGVNEISLRFQIVMINQVYLSSRVLFATGPGSRFIMAAMQMLWLSLKLPQVSPGLYMDVNVSWSLDGNTTR